MSSWSRRAINSEESRDFAGGSFIRESMMGGDYN
jgi:hypothetical protein